MAPLDPAEKSSVNTSASNTNPDLLPKPAATAPSMRRYFQRISIEGIDTYFKAPSKFEKRFWLFVILIGTAGTLVYLIPAITNYLKYTTVLDIGYQTSPDLNLPNTWICLWALNYTYFYDRFSEVKSRMRHDKRLQLFAKRLTAIWRKVYKYQGEEFPVDKVFNFTLSYITMPPISVGLPSMTYAQPQLLNEVLYRAIEAAGSEWPGTRSFYEKGFFDCPGVLRNCTISGIPIDCCRDSKLGYNEQIWKCYKIDMQRELLDNPSLIKQDQPIELSVETFTDSKYFPSSVVEPQEIQVTFQKHLPSMFDDVHYLAAGTASKVNVKGTRKLKISNCTDGYRYDAKLHVGTDPLVQQYFKDMQGPDAYSLEYCAMGKLMEAMSTRCGCVPYFDTLRPNDSVICTPAHIYACYYGAIQDTPEMEAMEKHAGVQQNNVFVDLKALIAAECAQLCESWLYDADVFSTIMDGEEGNISTYWRNKVTVTFDPEYRVETEMLKMDYHALLASIGDGLGLILGMSFITFVQLAVWPLVALRFRRRLRRVGYVIENDDANEASV